MSEHAIANASAMNTQPNPADFALALYETANQTHQRKDWRQACHALANALKSELLRTTAIAAPAPMPADAPTSKASPKKSAPKPVKAVGYEMTAESLMAALRLLTRTVERRNYAPILDQLLIEGLGDTLAMRATNLDAEIWAKIEAPGVGKWSATCDARQLLAILSKAKGAIEIKGELTEPYKVKVDGKEETRRDSKVTLSGAVSATLKGRDPGDFPVMNPKAALLPLKIAHADLASALEFVRVAVSTEETRYYLNGVWITRRGGCEQGGPIEIVATDGSRLNLIQCEPIGDGGKAFAKGGAVVPRDTALHMQAILKSAPFDLLAFSDTHCQMTAGPVVITSKLIDGNFPDYTRVIPKAEGQALAFDTADMLAALAKVSAISKEKSKAVRLDLTADLATLTLRTHDGAESSATVPCGWSGPDLSVSYHPAFLADAIKSLGCETVRMFIGGPNDPARLQDYDPKALDRLCVLMPLRT